MVGAKRKLYREQAQSSTKTKLSYWLTRSCLFSVSDGEQKPAI